MLLKPVLAGRFGLPFDWTKVGHAEGGKEFEFAVKGGEEFAAFATKVGRDF